MGTAHAAAEDGWLAGWLARLDAAGFHVGMRERLLAQTLLARLAVAGALPADPVEALRMLRPLLCSSPPQQQRYDELLREARHDGAAPAPVPTPSAAAPRPRWIWPLLFALLALAGVAAWKARSTDGPVRAPAATSSPANPPSAPTAAPTSAGATPLPPQPQRPGIFVPPRAMPFAPPAAPPWEAPLRRALIALAALSAIGLAWAAWRHRRREMALKALRSGVRVDEQVLREPAGGAAGGIGPPPALLRPASRLLRQRAAGAREELDLPATIRATIDAGGAFAPRTRRASQTPEYLVLVDDRGPSDHLLRCHAALLKALAAQGVALTVCHFERTPALGCWRVRPGGARFDRSSLAELAGRFAGHRLLVFADPAVALDPRDGRPQPWARQLKRDFPAAVWFTPRPVTSWDTAEYALAESRELGFLVLPVMAEALPTMAGWFASARAHLELPADMAGPWPPLLGDDPFVLALRQTPPPPETVDALLRELRQYLGAWRFQWLAACAVFPALSWPLTMGLGQALRPDDAAGGNGDAALASGAPLLAALPWFRYGRMPEWLRAALVAGLGADEEARCRRLVEQRLDDALHGGEGGDELVRIALRRAWLRRGDGVAQDRVLVDFLSAADRLSRLVQRVPEKLRRWLFRRGRAAYGLQPGWLALPVLGLSAGLFAASPAWQSALPGGDVARLESKPSVTFLAGAAQSFDISPDGLRMLVPSRLRNGSLLLNWRRTQWRAAEPGDADRLEPQLDGGAPLVAKAPALKAARLATSGDIAALLTEDGEIRQVRVRSGEVLAATRFTGPASTAIAIDPAGVVVAVGDAQGNVKLDRFAGSRTLVEAAAGQPAVAGLAYSADGRLLAIRDAEGGLRLTQADDGRLLRAPDGRGFVAMAFGAQGQRLWLGTGDGGLRAWDVAAGAWAGPAARAKRGVALRAIATDPGGVHVAAGWADGDVTIHDAATGSRVAAATGPIGTFGVQALAFAPDGSRVLAAYARADASVGVIQLFGRPPGTPLRVIGCRGRDPQQTAADWPALFDDRLAGDADAVAMTPEAAWAGGQLPDIAAGEVLYDPGDSAQAALAAAVVARLDALPDRVPSRWRRVPSPGLLAATVYACRGAERIDAVKGPDARAAAATPGPKVAPPALGAMRFEVFECSPGTAESAAAASGAQEVLRQLGAKEVRRTALPVEKFEALMGTQFAPYELRVSRGQADEAAVAQALLRDPTFGRTAPWRSVPVVQKSPGYLSLVACPARWAAAHPGGVASAAAPAASPAPPGAPAFPAAAASSSVREGRIRSTVVAASTLDGPAAPGMASYARRFAAFGDHWFGIGALPPATGSNLLVALEGDAPWLVVNASPAGTIGGVPGGSSDAALRRLLAGPAAYRWDAVLVSFGLDRLVAALQDPRLPLLRPRGPSGTADYVSPDALAALGSQLRVDLLALVRLRDSGINRGTPILLGTYDYPTPRPAGAGLGVGPWLWPAMRAAGVPEADQAALARRLVDQLAVWLLELADDRAEFPGVRIVDTRGVLAPAEVGSTGVSGDWANELTPSPAGYAKLAQRWAAAVGGTVPAAKAR